MKRTSGKSPRSLADLFRAVLRVEELPQRCAPTAFTRSAGTMLWQDPLDVQAALDGRPDDAPPAWASALGTPAALLAGADGNPPSAAFPQSFLSALASPAGDNPSAPAATDSTPKGAQAPPFATDALFDTLETVNQVLAGPFGTSDAVTNHSGAGAPATGGADDHHAAAAGSGESSSAHDAPSFPPAGTPEGSGTHGSDADLLQQLAGTGPAAAPGTTMGGTTSSTGALPVSPPAGMAGPRPLAPPAGGTGGRIRPLGPSGPPVANNDAYTLVHDSTLSVPAATGVLANDTDPDHLPLTAVLNSQPTHGTLTLRPNGSFVYVANAHYAGTDSFTYHANDGTDNSNVATVTLTLTNAHAPVAAADSYSVLHGQTLTVTAATGVLANDSDADPMDSLTATLVTGSGPSHGTLTLSADGSFNLHARDDLQRLGQLPVQGVRWQRFQCRDHGQHLGDGHGPRGKCR